MNFKTSIITFAMLGALATATLGKPIAKKGETSSKKDETSSKKDETSSKKDETSSKKDETSSKKDETSSKKNEAMETPNIAQAIEGSPPMSIFASIVKATDTGEILSSSGPFTIFAPSNSAFTKEKEEHFKKLIGLDDKKTLGKFIKSFLTNGEITSQMMKDGKIKPLNNEEALIAHVGNSIAFNKCVIVRSDVKVSNGIIHIIETIPETSAK